MDTNKASPQEAIIQMIDVLPEDEINLRRMLNRIWFFYRIEFSSLKNFGQFVERFPLSENKIPIDLVILNVDLDRAPHRELLDNFHTKLSQSGIPLISLVPGHTKFAIRERDHWINILLPRSKISKNVNVISDAIVDYWLSCSSKQ